MLDRLALLVPDWRERSPADLGVTLVELLAYVGDHLSYHQDAVATEAYLRTARRRAVGAPPRAAGRLRDARRLQRARLAAGRGQRRRGSTLARRPDLLRRGTRQDAVAPPECFEPVGERARSRSSPTTTSCSSTPGATIAAAFRAAPPARRCAASTPTSRRGRSSCSRSGAARAPDGRRTPTPGTATPCGSLGVRLDERPARRRADHRDRMGAGGRAAVPAADLRAHRGRHPRRRRQRRGRQRRSWSTTAGRREENLEPVPPPVLFLDDDPCADHCRPRVRIPVPARYRPRPGEAPLTWSAGHDPAAPAAAAFAPDLGATPAIELDSLLDGHATHWRPVRDLLNSGRQPALRRRDRARRHRRAALRRRRVRPAPAAGRGVRARPTASATARPATSARTRSCCAVTPDARITRCATRCRPAAAESPSRSSRSGAAPRKRSGRRSARSRQPTTRR